MTKPKDDLDRAFARARRPHGLKAEKPFQAEA
jgi:hypothetical protein